MSFPILHFRGVGQLRAAFRARREHCFFPAALAVLLLLLFLLTPSGSQAQQNPALASAIQRVRDRPE